MIRYKNQQEKWHFKACQKEMNRPLLVAPDWLWLICCGFFSRLVERDVTGLAVTWDTLFWFGMLKLPSSSDESEDVSSVKGVLRIWAAFWKKWQQQYIVCFFYSYPWIAKVISHTFINNNHLINQYYIYRYTWISYLKM